jgi:predicted esterase
VTKPRPIRTATEKSIRIARTARYYVLGDAAGSDLWFVLHGFGQLAGDFIEYFTELNDGTKTVVAPEALNRYYTASISVPSDQRPVGATWMTREFRDAEIDDYVGYLDALHDEIARIIRPRRTIVVGFSQGGATASRWVTRGKTDVHSLVLWGATLPPDLDLAATRGKLAQVRLRIVIGKSDQYILPDALARERQRLDSAQVPFDVIEYDAGHSIKRSVLQELAKRIEAD